MLNWLATYILCEGHIFEGSRNWIESHLPEKMAYLCRCQLCMGTWVGFAEALIISHQPFHGWYAIIASGLVFKAFGHAFLVIHKLGEAATKWLSQSPASKSQQWPETSTISNTALAALSEAAARIAADGSMELSGQNSEWQSQTSQPVNSMEQSTDPL